MLRRRALLGIEDVVVPPQIGTLLVDCPLNGNLTDYSGNNYHLTPASAVVYATNEGRQVLAPSQYSYADLTNPQQLTYINDFELHLEFYRMSDAGMQIILDSSASGTNPPGLQAPGLDSYSWSFILQFTSSIYNKFIVTSPIIPQNTWFKIVIRNSKNVNYFHVENMQGKILSNLTQPSNTIITTSLTKLRIGQTQHNSNRAFIGYLRNLKIWKDLI